MLWLQWFHGVQTLGHQALREKNGGRVIVPLQRLVHSRLYHYEKQNKQRILIIR